MLAFRGTIQALESAADRQAHNPSGSEFDNPEVARNMAKYVSADDRWRIRVVNQHELWVEITDANTLQ